LVVKRAGGLADELGLHVVETTVFERVDE